MKGAQTAWQRLGDKGRGMGRFCGAHGGSAPRPLFI